jgi:RHS repeat-associated protein
LTAEEARYYLTTITHTLVAANSNTLSYSPANRLAQANGQWGNMSLAYDGVGNRLSQSTTLAAVTTTRLSSYDALSNRITGMTENAAALRSYAYDGAGNIVTDTRPGEVFGFSYNARNRPTSVTRNSVAYASYAYNAFEQLVARETTAPGGPSGTVHYIHDLDGHIIAEADAATGAVTRDYIWMASNDNQPTDLPLAVAEGANLYHVHTDHLGRPTRMTDAAKASVWQAAYNPHGEAAGLSGTISNNLRFPGQVFQIETNLAYNWHRHYDATTGRYTQPDPLRFVDGPSIYAYAGNSPYMRTDRDGQVAPVVWALGGAAAGVAMEWYFNRECATWQDYVEAALLGAIPGGAAAKSFKAIKYWRGMRLAKIKYPKKYGRFENHHNQPGYLGGPKNGPTTNLNAGYHQNITNEFRKYAPYRGDKGYTGPLSPEQVVRVMQKVYDKYPLSWW